MKLVVLLAVLTVTLARPDNNFYDHKYENFNVKEITDNDRLLKAHVLCFLSKGKCTPEGNDMKQLVPEALETECGKCTDKQKSLVAEMLKAIMKQLPAEWDELVKIYKPEGKTVEDITKFINKHGPK